MRLAAGSSLAGRLARWRAVPALSALAGAGAWAIGVAALRPSPARLGWPVALLLLGPLFVAPMGLALVPPTEAAGRRTRLAWGLAVLLQPPAAIAFTAAFALPAGLAAGLLALPWLLVGSLAAIYGLLRLWRRRRGPASELALDAGLIYVAVGAAWALAHRLGLEPLGFGEVIVLLTAVHFHFAGLALPVATGLAARRLATGLSRLACLGVIAGVPAVAVGITASQLGWGLGVEAAATWVIALAAGITAWLHVWLAARSAAPAVVRLLWAAAGGSLLFSMGLAAAYGSRGVAPSPGLDVPAMWALHGTANALGFGVPGLLGWYLAARRESAPDGDPPEPGQPLRRRRAAGE